MGAPRAPSSRARRRGDARRAAGPDGGPAISDGHLALDELAPRVDVCGLWEEAEPRWHRYGNPRHHLLLIVRGGIRAVTARGRFTAAAGELVCFPPAPLNQYGYDAGTRFWQASVEFAPPPRHLLTPWLDGVGALPERVALGQRAARAGELFEALCVAVRGGSAGDRLRVRAAVLELLALAADAAVGATRRVRLDPWQLARLRLESALDRELPLAVVARELGVGPDQFSRRFRARFGVSPKRWRTHARLRWAAQRLRAGEGPIKAIARAVGMRDATAFARLFRRHFGVAPSDVAAGAITSAPATVDDGLLPLNRHLVPPDTPADWERRYRPPG